MNRILKRLGLKDQYGYDDTSIVGFIPIKSLDKRATDVDLGSSVIDIFGDPDIGRSSPFDIVITNCVPY